MEADLKNVAHTQFAAGFEGEVISEKLWVLDLKLINDFGVVRNLQSVNN